MTGNTTKLAQNENHIKYDKKFRGLDKVFDKERFGDSCIVFGGLRKF
jgi:hypothetical protein